MKKINIVYQLCLLVFVFLSACVGNNTSTNNDSNISSLLTIDSVGIIPVYYGISTKSVFFIHNNSMQVIQNITYEVISNNNDFELLNTCEELKANQECNIEFATPVLTDQIQGSALIKLKYTVNNQEYAVEEQLNYRLIDNVNQNGIYFASDLYMTKSNPINYGVIYMYANSNINNINFELNINNNTFTVNDMVPNRDSIGNHEIIAVEVRANNSSKFEYAKVNISTMQNVSTASALVSINPDGNGAQLISGMTPVINVLSNSNGSLVITNIGNQAASLTSIDLPIGLSLRDGINACSTVNGENKLNPGMECTIYFTASQIGGVGDITVSYSGGISSSLSSEIIWYNQIDNALLSMSATPKKIQFMVFESSGTLISMTNIGGYDLYNLSITAPTIYSGHAVPTVTSPISCTKNGIDTGNNMPIGGSCSYSISLTDIAAESDRLVNVGVFGNYTNNSGSHNYNRIMSVKYTAVQTPGTFIFKTEFGHNGDFSGNLSKAAESCRTDPANPIGAGNGTWKAVLYSDRESDRPFNTSTTYTVMNLNFVRESFIPTVESARAFAAYPYYKMLTITGTDASTGAWSGMTRAGVASSRCAKDGVPWILSTTTGVVWLNTNESNAQITSLCNKLMSLICVQQ